MKIVRPVTVDDAVLSASNVAETDFTAWAAGTTYAAGDKVRRVSTDFHKVFESAQAGNTGHDPLTDDGTWWTELGATNRWAMFDQSVQSQTTNADSIAVTLAISGRVDSLGLLNIAANQAQITVTDAVDGVVFDETYSLVSTSGITDWYAYFFEPIERITDLIVTDLPPYADPQVDVTLSEAGATIACGVLIAGLSKDIGEAQLGARIGIIDYSVKQADDFGNFVIVERSFSKTASFDVVVDNTYVDTLQKLLAGYRATPILYVGSDQYASTAVYGFYKEFSVQIAYPDISVCSLDLEGLT